MRRWRTSRAFRVHFHSDEATSARALHENACMDRPSLSAPPFPLEDLALGALAVLLMLPAVLFLDRLLHAVSNVAKAR